jgi:hypothetical protein
MDTRPPPGGSSDCAFFCAVARHQRRYLTLVFSIEFAFLNTMKSLTTRFLLLSTITFAGTGCFSDPTANAPTDGANAAGQGNGGQTEGGNGGQNAGGSAAGAGGNAGTPGGGSGAASGQAGSGAAGGQAGAGAAGGQAGAAGTGGGQAGAGATGGQAGSGAAGGGQAGAGNATGAAGGLADKDKYKTQPSTAALPPGPPANAPADGSGFVIQAATRLFLGNTDRTGQASDEAWMGYGLDIDGLTSTVDNTYHCQPVTGAKKKDVLVSGPGGIDNSFGKNFVGLLTGVVSDPSEAATQAIRDGKSSLLVRMENLGFLPNYTGINASFFSVSGTPDGSGGFLAETDSQIASGTYVWHARTELLSPNGTSKTVFPAAYLTSQTFVSGTARTDISFFLAIGDMEVVIHQAQLSMMLSDDHRTSTSGTIGGVLSTEEFVASFKKFAGSLSTALCSGSAADSIAQQIRQASDIMQDGTQDPTKVCDGISIGLGFETGTAVLGDAALNDSSPSPCQ